MAREAAVWDPAQYLRFAGERLRPALDLLAQVPLDEPARVVDLGCGAGNVTAILRQRFPAAEVVGVDGSVTMLEKARATVPQCRFEQVDFFQWQPATPLDLIYSNAALHWVDRHPTLFPRLLSFLAPGGVLAVQMPAMHDTPLRRIPYDLATREPWAEYLSSVTSAPAILSPAEYWDMLRPHVAALDMWQTTYMHTLSGEDAVMEWASGQQPSRIPRSAAGGATGAVPSRLCRRRAPALSKARRRHDAAAVPTAVHGGTQRVTAGPPRRRRTHRSRSRAFRPRRRITTARCRKRIASRMQGRDSPATTSILSCQPFSDPSASTTVARRSHCRSRSCMRLFQPSGMRRDRGFQAVMTVAPRASSRANNASGARRPIAMSNPAARYSVRR